MTTTKPIHPDTFDLLFGLSAFGDGTLELMSWRVGIRIRYGVGPSTIQFHSTSLPSILGISWQGLFPLTLVCPLPLPHGHTVALLLEK